LVRPWEVISRVASRDFGGERYAIDIDDSGNMTALTLPDGNTLQFKYDEYSRLLEETFSRRWTTYASIWTKIINTAFPLTPGA
jgi:YD repeat-containing protein